ncbi:hypothetical protein PoB_005188500 [Plakobranchus ocellatus]|uniref:Uncharacterized protein n=1 Tax=Plakobranchus ocellatus TaxID=259542 RepID=A0AAV4C1V4_9GAST|nr:hypothetical protein PoB_005188500 [Plakobranchus ocellatus]
MRNDGSVHLRQFPAMVMPILWRLIDKSEHDPDIPTYQPVGQSEITITTSIVVQHVNIGQALIGRALRSDQPQTSGNRTPGFQELLCQQQSHPTHGALVAKTTWEMYISLLGQHVKIPLLHVQIRQSPVSKEIAIMEQQKMPDCNNGPFDIDGKMESTGRGVIRLNS